MNEDVFDENILKMMHNFGHIFVFITLNKLRCEMTWQVKMAYKFGEKKLACSDLFDKAICVVIDALWGKVFLALNL